MKYYKDLYDTDPAEQGKTPERTWVFRTDSDGFCEYQKEYFVSGDELYYAASGDPSLPLGTITIQETQAPEGYLINPEIYVAKITSNNTGQEFVYTYNELTVPETGTSIQAGMLLLGIGCLAGAIAWYIRKGKKRDEEKKNSKTIDDRRNDRDHSF